MQKQILWLVSTFTLSILQNHVNVNHMQQGGLCGRWSRRFPEHNHCYSSLSRILFTKPGAEWRPHNAHNQRLFEQHFQQKSFFLAMGPHRFDLLNLWQTNTEKQKQNHPYAQRKLRRREIMRSHQPVAAPQLPPAPASAPVHPLEALKRKAVAQEDYLLAAKLKLQLQVRALPF